MKILVTGYNGFIGKNLVSELKNRGFHNLFLYDINTPKEQLDIYLQQCDFIFHLAGVNRTVDTEEFNKGNKYFTISILEKLKIFQNNCPIVVCSSIQSDNDTFYGKSKKAMEEAVFSYCKITGATCYVYRLPNVFGKWCKPNYNSVIATFCYNIARELPIYIDNPETVLNLVYIDDVVSEFINNLNQKPMSTSQDFCEIKSVHTVKLGEIAEKLNQFHKNRKTLIIPHFKNDFDRQLYATYTSYLNTDDFAYKLGIKTDERGYFCECIKSIPFGQVAVSVTKPGIIRGNHWHHTKVEKFMNLKGKALISFRKVGEKEILKYITTDEKHEIIDVPAGYTHSIKNIGDDDLIMLIWCNEIFDSSFPDTFFEEV